ncbi:hypothetical protein H4Q26_000282 [Puccinia striiformis f. sp. tritici PST-130]|nr:hypothetical protein Pst134EB_030977 [Puccinia striiformis f. sp. tritici]KAI9600499.1 hypothetical protein H4Q26_000282 [Puccinia striiformis f. sp. tritici PST-130]
MNSAFNILLKLALLGFLMNLPGVLSTCHKAKPISACWSRQASTYVPMDQCPPDGLKQCCQWDPIRGKTAPECLGNF